MFFNSSKKSCLEGSSGCSKDNILGKGGIWIWLSWESYGSSKIEMLVFLGLSFYISLITSVEYLKRIFPDIKIILCIEENE